MTTTKTRRWTHAVITAAAAVEMELPWARGSRRAAMILRRDAEAVARQPNSATTTPRAARVTH